MIILHASIILLTMYEVIDQCLHPSKQEMKVSTAWRARHASMIPMFAETQASNDTSLNSLLSYTQGSDTNMETDGPAGVQATQANVFSATQAPGNISSWKMYSMVVCVLCIIPSDDMSGNMVYSIGLSKIYGMLVNCLVCLTAGLII